MHRLSIESKGLPCLAFAAVRIAAIAVIGVAVVSIATSARDLSGWFAPVALAQVQQVEERPALDERVRNGYRCSGCGVIDSLREIDAPQDETAASQGKTFEISVRMQDGSMRRIIDAKPAAWRHGEPVTIIDGGE